MNERNILYIGGLESSQRGAVGTHTSGIICGFRDLGFHVKGVFLSETVPTATCHDYVLIPQSNSKLSLLRKIIDRFRIARVVSRLHTDAIRYHRFDPLLSPFIVDSNTILEYNDDTMEQIRFALNRNQWGFLGGLIRRMVYLSVFRFSEKICFRRAAKVVCVTKGLGEFVKTIQPNARIVVVPNGSNAEFDDQLLPIRALGDTKIRMAHIGTLTYWDGLIELLDAIAGFVAKKGASEIDFQIVGAGSLRAELVRSIDALGLKNVVTVCDSVSHKEALELLHVTDIVPLLKTIESYGLSPIKFYEARALGCYLIVSNIPHINEIDPSEGIVVPFPLIRSKILEAMLESHGSLKEIRVGRKNRAIKAQLEVSWSARVAAILQIAR